MLHEALATTAMLLPFPFYWFLWTRPKVWVNLCRGKDPCHTMSSVASVLKFFQLFALGSVANFGSSLPPFWVWILIIVGQALNTRVYQLLGEDGVYYGVRFGKNIPWVTKFPFNYIRDPQYMGSILSLLGFLYWVPFPYIALWCAGYVFMMYLESHEDVSTRAKKEE